MALNNHIPMKKKIVGGNIAPFMTKALSKKIMRRSKLKNNFNKNLTEENKSLCKKTKKLVCNLDLKVFEDDKKLCKTIIFR